MSIKQITNSISGGTGTTTSDVKKFSKSSSHDLSWSRGDKPSDILLAIQVGDFEKFKELVKSPFYFKDQFFDGLTPLHWTIVVNRPLFLKHLILKGSDVNAIAKKLSQFDGFTALHICAFLNRLECAKLLINDKNCKKFLLDKKKRYAFELGCGSDIRRLLLQKPKDGKHKCHFSGGSIYIGFFKDSKKHGKGKMYFPIRHGGGIMYDGNYHDGKRDGFGILYWPNNNVRYAQYDKVNPKNVTGGYWKRGKRDDYMGRDMIEYYKDGEVKYIGKYKKGKYEGKGKMYLRKDKYSKPYKVYSGIWKGGKRNGFGKEYYNPRGVFMLGGKRKGRKRYIGEWENDQKNGKGTMYADNKANSVVKSGFFINNKYFERLFVKLSDELKKDLVFMDINSDDFVHVKQITIGGQSSVHEYRYKSNVSLCVKKFTDKSYFLRALSVFVKNGIVQENHANIIKLIGYCNVRSYPSLVFELGEYSLLDYIRNKEIKKDLKCKINVLIEIVKGLSCLHDKCKIIHRDLNPKNILFVNKKWKIIDFALSTLKFDGDNINSNDISLTNAIGTKNYIAPEQFTKKYSYKADIFSFGMIMYQVLFNKSNLYEDFVSLGKKINEKICAIPSFRPYVNKEDVTKDNSKFVELMKLCWSDSVIMRPKSSELLPMLEGRKNVLEFKDEVKNKLIGNRKRYENEIKLSKLVINNNVKEVKSCKISLEVLEGRISDEKKEINKEKKAYSLFLKDCDAQIKVLEKQIEEIKKKRLKHKQNVEKKLTERIEARKTLKANRKQMNEKIEDVSNSIKNEEKKINFKMVKKISDCNININRIVNIANNNDAIITTERIPDNFYCKISGKIMETPVSLKCDKDNPIVFEKTVLEEWFKSKENKKMHPILKTNIEDVEFLERDFLKSEIENFFEKNSVKFD